MTATAVPDTHQAAVELAATVLCIQQCVGRALSGQVPHLGDIAAQARVAFGTRLADWLSMAVPVVHQLLVLRPAGALPMDDAELAPRYAGELGEQLNTDAADALALAVDVLTSRGQHPDVAWQRAVAGYGLDEAAMRGYLGAVVAPGADGVAPLLAANKKMATKALLAQAEKIGNREATAWSTLPVIPLSKAYDPQESRDRRGRWTAGARDAPEVKTEAGSGGDIVDRLLGDVQPEPEPGKSRYAAAEENRYAENRYAASRYGAENRYAENRYAQSRYGAPEQDRYTKPGPGPTTRRIFLFAAQPPSAAPPQSEPETADGYGIYLPLNDVAAYYDDWDNSRDIGTVEMNFGEISDALNEHYSPTIDRAGEYRRAWGDTSRRSGTAGMQYRIQPREYRSPWDAVSGLDVDADDWSELLRRAIPIWRQVDEDPLEAVEQLDTTALAEISRRAGYPDTASREILRQRITDQIQLRDSGARRISRPGDVDVYPDSGILDALADYVTWNDPRIVGDNGTAFSQDLEQTMNENQLEDPVQEVMAFGAGINDDDDLGDLRGRYKIHRVSYRSAINEFGYGAPPGKIAVRETHLIPSRV